MLPNSLKDTIQSHYRELLESRKLTPRYGQRLMIAEIARTLGVLCDDERAEDEPAPICVIEAGTGTGKTLAYLLATLPIAQELGLKVIVSTATIALQEQVLLKDIPELQRGADLQFSVALAKGRGRYLCLSRLDSLMQGSDSAQAMMDLYGEDLDDSGAGNPALYDKMLKALAAGDWQGDRDEWPEPLSESDWRPLTVDNAQCSGAKCSHFRNCYFYQARDSLAKADCIVTNHDLVLSDLALGGGVILPSPEDSIYVFDEAHHLPLKSNNHFSAFTRLRASIRWLERCDLIMQRLHDDELIDATERDRVLKLQLQLRDDLAHTLTTIEQIIEALESPDSYDSRVQHTFTGGVIPEALQVQAMELAQRFMRLTAQLELITDGVKAELDEACDSTRQQEIEQWVALLGSVNKRAGGNQQLWSTFAASDMQDKAPMARWLSYNEEDSSQDVALAASPVLAAESLQSHLWQTCAGAVLTSATLSALGRFDMLTMRAGLPQQTHYIAIPSPFDFAKAAKLVIPKLHCEPSNSAEHTAAMIRAVPRMLAKDSAALMLFSSRRQMQDVLEGLTDEWRDLVLCQDDYQKAQLLKFHRQRVDRGEGSIIFGLASLAEGIDLPGKYCTHVLIAKIPFAVPNDPIEMTLANWIEQQGQNAFMTLAVPDAAFRLVQASGRLLRNEKDTGQITLFDERIVSKRYGKQILDSLPPYTREVFTVDMSK